MGTKELISRLRNVAPLGVAGCITALPLPGSWAWNFVWRWCAEIVWYGKVPSKAKNVTDSCKVAWDRAVEKILPIGSSPKDHYKL